MSADLTDYLVKREGDLISRVCHHCEDGEVPDCVGCVRRTACNAAIFERLAYWEELMAAGRIKVLPFAIGTPVFFIAYDRCLNGKCPWLKDGKCSKDASPEYCPKEVLDTKYSMNMYLTGCRAFATFEEAEQAMQEGPGGVSVTG